MVEGIVRKMENDLRITVQLIDAHSGDQLWSAPYDGHYNAKIFGFQADIAKKVVASLRAVLTPREERSIQKIPTLNMSI